METKEYYLTFEITPDDRKKELKWMKTLPVYKKIKYEQQYCFSHSSGIGWSKIVKRTYKNGKVFELDLTDYGSW